MNEFFSVEQRNDRWWFITPEGEPFWSIGLNHIDAAMMVGYHAPAGSGGNPLAHTMKGSRIWRMRINDQLASEFLMHAYACAYYGVPVVMVAGDEALGEHVRNIHPEIETVAVKRGVGDSTVSMHPDEACARIAAETVRIIEDYGFLDDRPVMAQIGSGGQSS